MLVYLKKHLTPMVRQGQITIWSDIDLAAGIEWEQELYHHLESADIILLLISPDFLASDHCYGTEMERAIERFDQGSACVIPILLRSTLWHNAPFAKLQMLPKNAKPVKSWSDIDEAFNDITEHIDHLVSELQFQRLLTEAHARFHSGCPNEAQTFATLNQNIGPQEQARRSRLLIKLRNLYVLSHDGISPEMMAGLAPLPTEWTEQQLGKMGETWRQTFYY